MNVFQTTGLITKKVDYRRVNEYKRYIAGISRRG